MKRRKREDEVERIKNKEERGEKIEGRRKKRKDIREKKE